MKLVACQFDIAWENPQANYAKVSEMLKGAELEEGSLVALPEMFPTGFTMNVDAVAEKAPSPSEQFLAEQARTHKIFLLGGVIRRGPFGAVRNQSLVYSPDGELVSRYTKIQGFTLGGESDAYAAGDDIVMFAWNGFTVAQFVCYDLRFPPLYRAQAHAGAAALTAPAAPIAIVATG